MDSGETGSTMLPVSECLTLSANFVTSRIVRDVSKWLTGIFCLKEMKWRNL
jgi:hypothetical protein